VRNGGGQTSAGAVTALAMSERDQNLKEKVRQALAGRRSRPDLP
jgi:hypothetical protein